MRLSALLWLILPVGLFVIWQGLQVDVMEVDAAQYASIAREMLHSQAWLEVYEHGKTYQSKGFPDKPPLLFWSGALGMAIFGEGNVGFKIISVLAALLSIYAIGKWAELLYGVSAKLPARLFYGLNVGALLMMMDIRTDTLLVSLVVCAAWQLEAYLRTRKRSAFVWAFVALGFGMLAKGPLALIALAAAFGGDALLQRDWKRIFKVEWLLGLAIIGLLLSPMLYGLYRQWGWESGIVYYFWTQSFGRVTGENQWANDTSSIFLLESFLWIYLPWTLTLATALWTFVRQPKLLFVPGGLVAPVGFVLLFIAMSLSQYKLPHYIYIVLPFASLLLAQWYTRHAVPKALLIIHQGIALIILFISAYLLYFVVEARSIAAGLVMPISLLLFVLYAKSEAPALRFWGPVVTAFLSAGVVLNAWFYPFLVQYQPSSNAGKIAYQAGWSTQLGLYEVEDESTHALHFYSKTIVKALTTPEQLQIDSTMKFIYTSESGLRKLQHAGFQTRVLHELPYFKVTHLTMPFLQPNSREQSLKKRYILAVSH